MSILNTESQTPAQRAAEELRNISKQTFNMLKMNSTRGYNTLWSNPRATPSEILAELGEDAAEILRLGGLGVDTLNEAKANSCTLALPGGVTINPDGTVNYTPPAQD